MNLYMIRQVSDGKYLRKINGYYMLAAGVPREKAVTWSETPAYMLRTPDGVAANLRKLCSEPYWDREAPKGVWPPLAAKWEELAWRNFDASLLDQYEVVTMNVDILSMRVTAPAAFAQIEAIATAPLSRKERNFHD